MKKIFLPVFLLASFLFLGFVSATDTEITINTLPNHDVEVYALQPDQVFYLIESSRVDSNSEGVASVVLSLDVSEFDLKIIVKEENSPVFNKRYDETFPAGTPINLDAYPDWYIQQKKIEEQMRGNSNDSSSVEEALVEENSSSSLEEEAETNSSEPKENRFGLVGHTIFGDDGLLQGKYMYIIGAVVLLFAVLLGGSQMMKLRRNPSSDKIEKDSKEKKEGGEDLRKELEDAERRIKEAQEEIARIKSKTSMSEKEKKIMEAKKKLIEDQKELMKLRSEED